MPVNNLRYKPRKVLITGKSGCGKSSFAEFLILQSNYRRIIIYDSQDGEFAGRLGVQPVHSLAQIAQIADKERIVCFDPGEDENAFEDFCLFCWEYGAIAGFPILVVVDELQEEINAFNCPPIFRRVYLRGRRRQIDMLIISTQPNLIHNVARSQITEIICFGQADENAVKFVKPWGFSEELLDLPEHVYFRKTLGHQDLHQGKILFSKNGVISLDKTKNVGEIDLPEQLGNIAERGA